MSIEVLEYENPVDVFVVGVVIQWKRWNGHKIRIEIALGEFYEVE